MQTTEGATTLPRPPSEKRRGRAKRPEPPDHWPPGDGDGDGDGGNGGRGGGGGGYGRGDGSERVPDSDAGQLAFVLMLIGIGTLFLTFVGGYLVLRRHSPEWMPPPLVGPPIGLWSSSLLLLLTSVALAGAARAARAGRNDSVARRLGLSLALAFGFLACQAATWAQLVRGGVGVRGSSFGTIFYTLTGLHAAHVLGGMVYLVLVRLELRRRGKTSPGAAGRCAGYWHFMGLVWLLVLLVLYWP